MLLILTERLRDVQNEDVHLVGGGTATAPLCLHQGREQAGRQAETALHHHVGEMSRGKDRTCVTRVDSHCIITGVIDLNHEAINWD